MNYLWNQVVIIVIIIIIKENCDVTATATSMASFQVPWKDLPCLLQLPKIL